MPRIPEDRSVARVIRRQSSENRVLAEFENAKRAVSKRRAGSARLGRGLRKLGAGMASFGAAGSEPKDKPEGLLEKAWSIARGEGKSGAMLQGFAGGIEGAREGGLIGIAKGLDEYDAKQDKIARSEAGPAISEYMKNLEANFRSGRPSDPQFIADQATELNERREEILSDKRLSDDSRLKIEAAFARGELFSMETHLAAIDAETVQAFEGDVGLMEADIMSNYKLYKKRSFALLGELEEMDNIPTADRLRLENTIKSEAADSAFFGALSNGDIDYVYDLVKEPYFQKSVAGKYDNYIKEIEKYEKNNIRSNRTGDGSALTEWIEGWKTALEKDATIIGKDELMAAGPDIKTGRMLENFRRDQLKIQATKIKERELAANQLAGRAPSPSVKNATVKKRLNEAYDTWINTVRVQKSVDQIGPGPWDKTGREIDDKTLYEGSLKILEKTGFVPDSLVGHITLGFNAKTPEGLRFGSRWYDNLKGGTYADSRQEAIKPRMWARMRLANLLVEQGMDDTEMIDVFSKIDTQDAAIVRNRDERFNDEFKAEFLRNEWGKREEDPYQDIVQSVYGKGWIGTGFSALGSTADFINKWSFSPETAYPAVDRLSTDLTLPAHGQERLKNAARLNYLLTGRIDLSEEAMEDAITEQFEVVEVAGKRTVQFKSERSIAGVEFKNPNEFRALVRETLSKQEGIDGEQAKRAYAVPSGIVQDGHMKYMAMWWDGVEDSSLQPVLDINFLPVAIDLDARDLEQSEILDGLREETRIDNGVVLLERLHKQAKVQGMEFDEMRALFNSNSDYVGPREIEQIRIALSNLPSDEDYDADKVANGRQIAPRSTQFWWAMPDILSGGMRTMHDLFTVMDRGEEIKAEGMIPNEYRDSQIYMNKEREQWVDQQLRLKEDQVDRDARSEREKKAVRRILENSAVNDIPDAYVKERVENYRAAMNMAAGLLGGPFPEEEVKLHPRPWATSDDDFEDLELPAMEKGMDRSAIPKQYREHYELNRDLFWKYIQKQAPQLGFVVKDTGSGAAPHAKKSSSHHGGLANDYTIKHPNGRPASDAEVQRFVNWGLQNTNLDVLYHDAGTGSHFHVEADSTTWKRFKNNRKRVKDIRAKAISDAAS